MNKQSLYQLSPLPKHGIRLDVPEAEITDNYCHTGEK
jgi:hypothetical protein